MLPKKHTGTIYSSTRRTRKMEISSEHSHCTSRGLCWVAATCMGGQDKGLAQKPQEKHILPCGTTSAALLALLVKGAANLCSAQVAVGPTRGKILPPHPAALTLPAQGPKKKTHSGVFALLRYSIQMLNLPSARTHPSP